MSGTLEQAVDETLNSNFRKLEERFDSDHEIETDFTAVQGMGNITNTIAKIEVAFKMYYIKITITHNYDYDFDNENNDD
jgi:hypothetical protein